jgi:hypothetical protein
VAEFVKRKREWVKAGKNTPHGRGALRKVVLGAASVDQEHQCLGLDGH